MPANHGTQPVEPETAVELYLREPQDEISKATLYAHRSRLGHFLRWCDERDITRLDTLTGRNL